MKLSILTATYNRAKYLERIYKSIHQNQLSSNIEAEWIIIDDGSTDDTKEVVENFVSENDADYYASLYKENNLPGGHIILLNSKESEYFESTRNQALRALHAYIEGMQIGGGVNDENAREYINEGASHIIVTSYVFKNGTINYENLDRLVKAVGKKRVVLDLSCRKRDDKYYVVTDRWQKFTDVVFDEYILSDLSAYCDEFLIHAVDVEGKNSGIEEKVAGILGNWSQIPVTYAGGIKSVDDIEKLKDYGKGAVDFTIGSSLDIFGGKLSFERLANLYHN